MLRLYYKTAGAWQVSSNKYDGETVEAILDYAKKNFSNGPNLEIRENGEIREGVLLNGAASAPVTFRRLVTGRRFRR